MTTTPMTKDPRPTLGHILINKHLHTLDNLFLNENGNGVWTWCAVFKIGGKVQSLEGADFPSKSRAMGEALSYGCSPSAYWFRGNYPDHEAVAA